MKKEYTLLAFCFVLFASTGFAQTNNNKPDFFTPDYFNLLKEHIKTTGTTYTADVSGIKNGGLIVTYHSIKHNNWKATIDHTHRIYFSTLKADKETHFGNILMENNKVRTEISYGLGRAQTKEEIKADKIQSDILTKEYNALIEKIIHPKK